MSDERDLAPELMQELRMGMKYETKRKSRSVFLSYN